MSDNETKLIWEYLREAEKKRGWAQRLLSWAFFISLVCFSIGVGILLIAFLGGCSRPATASAKNENAVSPITAPKVEGEGNKVEVNQETKSESDQKSQAGEVTTGDVSGDSNVVSQKFELSAQTTKLVVVAFAMILGLVLFGYCASLLVNISLTTLSDWAVFGVGVGGLVIAVYSGVFAVL